MSLKLSKNNSQSKSGPYLATIKKFEIQPIVYPKKEAISNQI